MNGDEMNAEIKNVAKHRRYLDIQIYGEGNTEVVRICEHLSSEPRPLLRYFTNLRFNIKNNCLIIKIKS